MSLEEHSALMEKLGTSLSDGIDEPWREIRLNVTGAGALTKTQMTVVLEDGSTDETRSLSNVGSRAVSTLRKKMYSRETGTWYNATFTLAKDGGFDANFDYETCPFGGKADDDLLLKDQQLWPRSAENLPDWHPAKAV